MEQQLVPNEVIPQRDQEPQPYSSTQQQIPLPPQPSYTIQNVPVGPQEGCFKGRSERFMDTARVSTGVIQIVLGVFILILSVIIQFNERVNPSYSSASSVYFILPTGILGVCTKKKNSSVIIGYLVMSILAAAYSLISAIYEGSLAVAYSSRSYLGYENRPKALHSFLTFFTVIEFIVAIVAAAICCVGLAFCHVCCDGSAPAQHPAVAMNIPVGPQEGCFRGRSERFMGTAGVSTGVIQIVLGVIILILSVIIQFNESDLYPYNVYLDTSINSNVIVFILPAGILGVCTKKKNSGVIISCLVMSILAAVFSIFLAIYEGSAAATAYDSYSRSYRGYENRLKVLHSFVAFFTVIEFIVAIVAAAICCVGLARCCAGSTPVQHPTVMNYSAPIGGQQNATAQANVNHGTESISAQP